MKKSKVLRVAGEKIGTGIVGVFKKTYSLGWDLIRFLGNVIDAEKLVAIVSIDDPLSKGFDPQKALWVLI